jgi:hypothetical protein
LEEDLNTEVIRLPNSIRKAQPTQNQPKKDVNEIIRSPSLFLRDLSKEINGGQIYCECGNLCEGANNQCSSCLKGVENIELTGFLYMKTKETQFKRYWYKLLNKELLCISLLIFNKSG